MFRPQQVKGDQNPKPAATCEHGLPFHHIPDNTWKKNGYSLCFNMWATAETAGCASEALKACMLWIWQLQNLDEYCILKVS